MSFLISVIVPIYNVEKYIERCIISIQNQSYKNLEIILVNDGSPDGSLAICERLASQDKRIIIFNQKNGGLSSARNSGIKIAKGEYLTFVDSDDTIDKQFIENLYNLVNTHNTKIGVTLFKHVREGEFFSNNNEKFKPIHLSQDEALMTMFYQDLFDNNATVKLFHKSLFENVVFPEGLLYEDLLTTYKLILLSENGVAFAPVHDYNYLLRNDSIEGSPFHERKYKSLEYIIKDLETLKIRYPHLEKCINSRILSFLFHLLFETDKNSIYENEIFKLIKKYRFLIIRDKDARKKARLAGLISFGGINLLRIFYTFGKSRA